jgi:hypothetical protein
MSWITKILGLDTWKSGLSKDQIEKHIVKLDPGVFYIIQVNEDTTPDQADSIRRTLESHGVFSIVVAVDSMRILSLTSSQPY